MRKKHKLSQPKVSHESEADVLTWELSNKNIYSAKEMENVVVHFTKNDIPVLIEILDASKFLAQSSNAGSSHLRNTAQGIVEGQRKKETVGHGAKYALRNSRFFIADKETIGHG